MQVIWNTIFYQPIYNALIFLINNVTFGDVGFAIIILTIIVKFILLPLTKKSIKSQVLMKKLEPEIKEIKEKHKDNKEEIAKKTFELYKKNGTSPFSGCLVLILQLPVIFALYYVFLKGLNLDSELFYSFIKIPVNIHTNFLGLVEMHDKSIVLGVLAGITQFIQGQITLPSKKKGEALENKSGKKSFQEEITSSMNTNIKYILPVFIAFIAYKISAAVALYWITSNIFTILQEKYIRNKLKKEEIK